MREPPGPLWGRAASCCLLPRWCSGRRRARPPARSPHASLWLGVVDLEARPGPAAAHRYRGLALLWSLQRRAKPSNAVQPRGGLQSVGTRCLFVARPGPAAAYLHRGRVLLLSLRHYANPSNNERPGPQPHKQTLNNVRTRPVVQCLSMGRCAYPRLGLLVWWCTRSVGITPLLFGCTAT